MMIKVFTIHDSKANAYLPPFFMNQEGQAIRTFTDCINSPKHQFSHHPQDYTLFTIGEFNDQTAGFTYKAAPISLGNGVEFIGLTTQTGSQDGQDSDDPPLQRYAQGGDPA